MNSLEIAEIVVKRHDNCKSTVDNLIVLPQIEEEQHKDVLRSIQRLDCSKEFSERNFALAEYSDNQGKPRPMYEMTKDGFVFLVMGFTGKESSKFKEAYINAFNWMQEELLKRGMSLMQRYNFVSLKYQVKKCDVSNSARNMRNWQDEKPMLLGELATLESQLQPNLPTLEKI